MRLTCKIPYIAMKARTVITCTNCLHMNGPTLHAKVNGSNIFQTKSKMNEEHKRYLKHTASVGLLGCSITPERTRVQTLQKDNEHVLIFAESFSSSTGGIIEEGDESNEDSNEHRINIDTNGPLNDFKISVEEAIQAFKGTSSTMTVDDKINRVCQNYRMLATSDSKCDALAFLACNLGSKNEEICRRAEDFLKCRSEPDKILSSETALLSVLLPEYNELFRHVGHLEGGVKFLVDLRSDLMETIKLINETTAPVMSKNVMIMLRKMNIHLKSLLAYWFSVAFLRLEQITWNSSCSMLQKCIRYVTGQI